VDFPAEFQALTAAKARENKRKDIYLKRWSIDEQQIKYHAKRDRICKAPLGSTHRTTRICDALQ
jgi:hypothetical protein